MGRLYMAAALALTVSACATTGAPTLQTAIGVHNTAKHIIEASDAIYMPIYSAEYASADTANPGDNAALKKAMAPWDAILSVLSAAKQTEQLFQLGVSQWQAGVDDGHLTAQMAACAAESFDRLAHAIVSVPAAGPMLYAASETLMLDMQRISAGVTCSSDAVNTLTGAQK